MLSVNFTIWLLLHLPITSFTISYVNDWLIIVYLFTFLLLACLLFIVKDALIQ